MAIRERIRQLQGRLRFDPARITLGWWLAAGQVLVVLLVAGGMSFYAIGRLRDLANQQGLARAQLAGAMEREELRRLSEDLLTTAGVLADRPTLQRLLTENRSETISLFLRRFCQSGNVDSCAVIDGANVLAQAGVPLPWNEVIEASTEQSERFMAAPAQADSPLLGAAARLSEGSSTKVYVVRLLNARLARELSRHAGLQIGLVNYRAFTNAPVNDFTSVHSAGLADGQSAVQRVESLDVYAASFPVFASTGEAIALIEVRLPATEIDATTSRLVRRLLMTTLLLAFVAVMAGMILGRVVTGPVRALTDAAVRLGQGDFSTSIPRGGAAEVGVLARTMEDMRRNLVDLTSTLRRREAEAQAVLAGIVEGVYAVDKNRIIRYLNPQAAKLLGINAGDAVGRFCGDVLKPHPVDGRRPCDFNCPIVQARRDGTAVALELLQPHVHQDRTAIITSSGMMDNMQVQVIRDETELEAVRRARDSVLANISHEFRTPLAAQLASIELLREGLATMPPEQLHDLVLSLERGTLRLTRLIDNLLESVRIESGQLGIRKQSVDLTEVVTEAGALMGSLLRIRHQTLEVDVPEDLPLISGDRTRLTQVFVNLLANASKFAPEHSTVRIGAAAIDSEVTAWVEDEGPGVQDVESGSIFERFHRGEEEEPEPGGLGLGLWIVKSIVDRHGGTVTVERTVENRTRFSLTLPAEAFA